MKFVICMIIGAVVGGFGMRYVDNERFAHETNTYISQKMAELRDAGAK